MSSTNNDTNNDTDKEQDLEITAEESNPVEDDPVDDDPVIEDSSPLEDAPADKEPAKQRGNGVAWIAILLSLIALTGVGYTVYQDWLAADDSGANDVIEGLDRRLSTAQTSVKALDARLAELDGRNDGASAQIDALKQEVDERVRLLSSLPARMTTLEGSVSSLAGISDGARDAWLLAEAEYYMQIANAQAQLANNPQLATLALKMADERIVQLGNPSLTDVRRAISDELAALDVMKKPDIAGATLTLASLARVVESLPLTGAATTTDADDTVADEEQGGVERAWSSMKGAMSGLVKVTPPDKAKLALLSPDGEYFLRNNLALQLQSARLALLRGEQTVFEQALDDTSTLLSTYFDSDSAQVESAQETLTEIRGNVFTTSIPDISESLRLLRQFRTLRENSQ